MQRLYDAIIRQHLTLDEEMLFLSGPRQVGKTTTSQNLVNFYPYCYLNWDNEDHRQILLQGPTKIMELTGLNTLSTQKPVLGLDEIHKHPDWKNFLKGFYDSYKDRIHFVITGSTRLDIYKKGGDSLMGRYFQYRMHPLSIAEIATTVKGNQEISEPHEISEEHFQHLIQFGGYPKPFLRHDPAFSLRWQQLRKQQLIREDIRDVNSIHDLQKLGLLIELLEQGASHTLTYSNLANKIRVSVDTIARWIEVLESFYYCYLLKPWSRNISRSLIKEPKVYLWDWSVIKDPGAKTENFIASHLLKACHYWSDIGLGLYDLYYIRDKEKNEVDFVVTKNDEPWFLVEVKTTDSYKVNPNLQKFQEKTEAAHAFQVVLNMPYVDKNCFDYTSPIIVPAKTLLSQLV